jgi:hypothetical protein
MPPKGKVNNPNGRPIGAKNKVGADLKERISKFLNDKFDDFSELWDGLEAKDKARIYVDVIPYVVPKMASANVTFDTDQVKKTINDLFPDSLTAKNGSQSEPATPE